MREMSTDRPDRTESPITVDAGHFQLEMDVLSYSYDRHNPEHADTKSEQFNFASLNLKAGLLHNWDLQLLIPSYNVSRSHDYTSRTVEKHRGFGDLTLRSKVNFWGNDSGPAAFGVMPFVKLPTNQDELGNNSVEGGIILPFGMDLPLGWGMGTMLEVDVNRSVEHSGYHPEFIYSITFGHPIYGRLSGYVEWFALLSEEAPSEWESTFDVGFTCRLSDNIQLDTGINIGLTRSASDLNPFLGLSYRF